MYRAKKLSLSLLNKSNKVLLSLSLLLFIMVCEYRVLATDDVVPEHRMKVAFIHPGFDKEEYWNTISEIMTAAANDLDIDLGIYRTRHTPELMKLVTIDLLHHDKPDYIITTNEGGQAIKIINEAKKSHVPVLLIKDPLTDDEIAMLDSSANATLVGSILVNDFQAGYQLLKNMTETAKKFDTNKTLQFHTLVALVNPESNSALMKKKGLNDFISENEMIAVDNLVTLKSINDSAQIARSIADQEKSSYPLSFIWSNSDEISMLLYKLIQKNKKIKRSSHVYIGGIGWSKLGLDGLRTGEMTVNVGGDIFIGAAAIVMLYDFANGIKFPAATKIYNIPLMQPMTPELMAQFDLYLPNYNWGLIDFTKLSKFRNQEINNYDFSLHNLFNNAKSTAP